MKMTALLLFVGMTSVLGAQTAPPDSPVARWGALHIENAQLTGSHGEAVVLRGMSLFDTTSYGEYANPDVLAWLRDDWKASVFRAAMYTEYNGKFVGEAAFQPLFAAVQAAIDTGVYVIVDWHILTDGNPLKHVSEAKDFFSRVAARYGSTPNVLYEICNEPNGNGVTWAEAIKPYAEQVIPVIRGLAPDSVIIVGNPVWSSQPETAAADPLPFPNLMYTLHFYAGSHPLSFLAKIDQARAAGAAVFVTEWGTTTAQVTGTLYVRQSLEWVKGLAERKVSWANWSLGTKLEPASALKPLASVAGSWAPGELTENGLLMRSILRGEATDAVFADSFDSGNFKAGGWLRSGSSLDRSKGTSGTDAVRFEGEATLTKGLVSDAYHGWTWSFQGQGRDWKPVDRLFIEVSSGATWTKVGEVSLPSADWVRVQGSLPEGFDHKPGLQWRLRSALTSAARYWVDNVEISASRD